LTRIEGVMRAIPGPMKGWQRPFALTANASGMTQRVIHMRSSAGATKSPAARSLWITRGRDRSTLGSSGLLDAEQYQGSLPLGGDEVSQADGRNFYRPRRRSAGGGRSAPSQVPQAQPATSQGCRRFAQGAALFSPPGRPVLQVLPAVSCGHIYAPCEAWHRD
jgi:hypothetical protein